MSQNHSHTSNSHSQIGMLFYLADGTIQSCNANVCRILGYDIEQLIGFSLYKLPWQRIERINSASVERNSESAFWRNNLTCEDRIVGLYRPDGILVWLSVNSLPLFKADDSQPYGAEITFVRATKKLDRKQIEARPLSQQFKTLVPERLIELLPEIVYIYDAIAQRNVYINSQIYNSLGYNPGEISGLEPDFMLVVMHPEDFQRFRTHLTKLRNLQLGEESRFEYRMRHKNGSWRWFCSLDRVYSRDNGRVRQIIGITRDITNRKETEIALRESQQRLELATEASGIGMWFWDLNEELDWTELGKSIFGLPSDRELSFTECFNRIHVEDRSRVRSALDNYLAELGKKHEYNIEYRVVWSDGSIHWLKAKGKSFFDKDGIPISMTGTVQDITHSIEAAHKLRESEQLLRLALHNAKAGTWNLNLVDSELVWSPENYELYGIDPQTNPLYYENWSSLVHSEDLAASNDAMQKVLTGEAAEFKQEFRIYHPQKGIRWVLGIGNVTYDDSGKPIRLSGINLDISDRQEAAEALRQSQAELKLITEIIPQQVWTAQPNGEVDYANQRWLNYGGITLADVQNQAWKQIVHPDDLPMVERCWSQAIASGQDYNIEARLRRANGKYHWFLVRARALRHENGEITRWYGTNTNITRIKQLEERLRQQSEDLKQANQLKDDFLAIVSHELRTPLNPILGWSQLLASDRLTPEKIAQGLEVIQRNARLQSQLIDDLLDVSSILRGKLKLSRRVLNLRPAIAESIATVQFTAEAKSIQIETKFEPDVSNVLGDADRLRQVFWNLISNAIKFTPDGGRVTVSLRQENIDVLIEIRDTGQGITPEFLPFVFERFRQAESGSTRNFGGLGLGLAIVSQLVKLHGGTVEVFSAGIDRGSTFLVRLPSIITTVSEPDRDNDDADYRSTAAKLLRGCQILIVDDEADSLDISIAVLEAEGALVTSVNSAAEALTALSQLTPSLLISDIGMPGIDGYELISLIRQLPHGRDIPAIAITAYTADSDRQRVADAGFQKYLAKPIDLAELFAAIEDIIGKTEKY